MGIRFFEEKDIEKATELFNRAVEYGDIIYSPYSNASFRKKFFDCGEYTKELLLVWEENDCVEGFISGMIKKEYLRGENFGNTPGYLTFMLVSPEKRRKGIASALLDEFCKNLKTMGKKNIAITYRNTMILDWIVPNSNNAHHNNAPGCFFPSPAYNFFLNKGFIHEKTEDGLYLNLTNYAMPEKALKKEEKLKQEGIEITFYDKKKHYGYEELFNALHGEVWRKTINDNEKRDNPLPVLVASEKGKIIGFAGPIDREENGRGYFNGIATHPDYERRGIATVLFCRLMEEFRRIGAEYSTIFTDEENPALVLYENVGFRIGQRFAVMNKELC